mmetsp:Transcript_38450/g.28288  ORF Transcript_38450/g.28288 Transcript_38450/m.28288 type:complete len:112 (+) Transcript_38450:440-775(+)
MKSGKHPMLIVKYEDLMAKIEEVMKSIVEFIFEQPITGTYVEKRIQQVLKDSKSGRTYEPRNAGKSSNLRHYTQEHLAVMKKELKKELLFYGYHKCEENPNSPFDYGQLDL